MAKEHQDKSEKKGGKAHGGFTDNPGSGVSDSKRKKSGKGKAKMSEAAWNKLSSRQRERDYGGSRFESKSTGGTRAGRGQSEQ